MSEPLGAITGQMSSLKINALGQSSNLLRLPGEIRDRVWTSTMPRTNETHNVCPCLDYPKHECDHYKKGIPCAFWRDEVRGELYTSLPRVNRQVYQETKKLARPPGVGPSIGVCSPKCLERLLEFLPYSRRNGMKKLVCRVEMPVPTAQQRSEPNFHLAGFFFAQQIQVANDFSLIVRRFFFLGCPRYGSVDEKTGKGEITVTLKGAIRRSDEDGLGMLVGEQERMGIWIQGAGSPANAEVEAGQLYLQQEDRLRQLENLRERTAFFGAAVLWGALREGAGSSLVRLDKALG